MAENDIVNNIPAENEPEENAAGIPAGAEKIQYPDMLTVEPSRSPPRHCGASTSSGSVPPR